MRTLRLGNVCTKIGSGATPRGGSDVYLEHGIALIRSQNIYNDGFRSEGLAFIGNEHAAQLANVEVEAGDILLNITGDSVARTCRAPEEVLPARVNQHVAIIRPDPEHLDPRFLHYHLISPAKQTAMLSLAGGGATRNALTKGMIEDFEVPAPSPEDQRAIAGVLGALDDKIEQNRRTARALERLARTIFRAWFVDFEPVKAKASGATAFPSMPQFVFDALPTRFVDSEIGPVPEGWEAKSIATIATFLNGLALQKYPPRGDGEDLRVIKIAELRKGSADGADWANGDVPEQYVIGDRDLLFSWSGTLEAEFWFGGKGALNQHLFKVTSSHFPNWFCFLWIRQHLPWFRAIAASKATTMGHIKREHLQETRVVVPPKDVLRKANGVIGSLYDLYAQQKIESRKLAMMRDLLLPKLLSGEVRVQVGRGADSES
ncbi:MAG: restriction endonuclease subunit S [Candidatus Eisenbacteria bacterium]